MTHKMIVWFLIFNPNSWLIDGSFSLPLFLNAKKNVNGEIYVEKHRAFEGLYEAPSQSLWLALLAGLLLPRELGRWVGVPYLMFCFKEGCLFVSPFCSVRHISGDNGLTDAETQPGSAYVDFMFISLSYSQPAGCCLPWLNSRNAHNSDILLCVYIYSR